MRSRTPAIPPAAQTNSHTAAWPCLRIDGRPPNQRVVLDLSISPNAKRTELVGWHDGALRVRLAAPPVDGAANDALRRWLADELKLTLARVELLRGASGRRKQLALDTDELTVTTWLARQETLCGAN
ncbi:MAG: DUF167 domain-containing protein [Pseudomonadota bacterium]